MRAACASAGYYKDVGLAGWLARRQGQARAKPVIIKANKSIAKLPLLGGSEPAAKKAKTGAVWPAAAPDAVCCACTCASDFLCFAPHMRHAGSMCSQATKHAAPCALCPIDCNRRRRQIQACISAGDGAAPCRVMRLWQEQPPPREVGLQGFSCCSVGQTALSSLCDSIKRVMHVLFGGVHFSQLCNCHLFSL